MKLVPGALLLVIISGCTTIADHSETPIELDPTKRTLGSWVDDQRLESVIAHNVGIASTELAQANVQVDAFNGVILLTGQVASAAARSLAGDVARAVNGVRQVHNELEIQNNISVLGRANDIYLASKVKLSLYADDEIAGSRIDVVCENSVVYLMGLITRADGELAAQKASMIGGVRRVIKVFEYVD